MCLILEPIPLINVKIESILMKLLWEDARNYEEFKPFVKFVEESKWMTELKEYCEKHNKRYPDEKKKDLQEYLNKTYMINPLKLGASGMTAIVPRHICKVDVMDKTEKYKIWCKCTDEYIDKNLK